MKRLTEAGFAALHGLLALIIVGLIIGTGWYVWHSNQETDAALEASNNAANSTTSQSTTKNNDESEDWLLYTAPSNNFSLRLPDGWQLERYMKSDALYAFGTEKLVYQKGTKATVTEVDGGKDGLSVGIFLNYAAVLPSDNPLGSVEKTFTTTQGASGTLYKYVETTDAGEGMEGLPLNGILYSFVVVKDGHSVVVGYGIGPSDKDQLDVVERAVRTFKFK